MPVITRIAPQKNGKRVNIYLDGKFGFGIDLENYVTSGLKVENEYTEEEINSLVKKAEFQKVYDKMLRFASLRPRSRREFETWLKKHKVPESLNSDLFERLERLEFLDDRKFAAWWVSQRMQFRPKSGRVLKIELGQKGVDRKIIEEVLDNEKIDEKSVAKKLLEKKEKTWSRFDETTARRKKAEYLQRNGFNWEIIKEILLDYD